MAGLGKANNSNGSNGIILNIAGGFLWNKKAGENDPDYAQQTWVDQEGTEKVRAGAQYGDIAGTVTNVYERTHKEYGDSLNVTIDIDGQRYTISTGLEGKEGTDLIKALILFDKSKELFIKPYDFLDKSKKRRRGLSFRQDGEKLDLKGVKTDYKSAEWFADASKRDIKKFFSDILDDLMNQLKPTLQHYKDLNKTEESNIAESESATNAEVEKSEEVTKTKESKSLATTPLKMKKALREYIAENYPDKELPKSLKGEELKAWYKLCLDEEELPFEDDEPAGDQVNAEIDDVEDQLNALL